MVTGLGSQGSSLSLEFVGFKIGVQHDSEFSKNHTDDQESVENCRQIPFLNLLKVSDGDHFNPGQAAVQP